MNIIVFGDVQADSPARMNYVHLGEKRNYMCDAFAIPLSHAVYHFKRAHYRTHDDVVVFVGDIFAPKDKVPNRAKNMMIDIVKNLSTFCKVIILRGNHDNEGYETTLKIFEPYAQVVHYTEVLTLGKYKCLFVPYTLDYKQVEKTLKKEKPDFMFAHCDLKGAMMNSKIVSPKGVRVKLVDKYTKIAAYFGHFHSPQRITKKVFVVGSVYQEDWGEVNDVKTFCSYIKNKHIVQIYKQFLVRRYLPVPFRKFAVGERMIIGKIKVPNTMSSKQISDLRQQYLDMGVFEVHAEIQHNESSPIHITSAKQIDNRFKRFLMLSLKQVEKGRRQCYDKILKEALYEST